MGERVALPANIVGQVIKANSKSRWNPDDSSNDDNFSVSGDAVRSTWPAHLKQGTNQRKSETSIATPIAAGIAALVLEFATQKPQNINSREILWRYEGVRAIFAKMAPSRTASIRLYYRMCSTRSWKSLATLVRTFFSCKNVECSSILSFSSSLKTVPWQ